MAAQWKVKDGTQVKYDGKLYGPGDTFSAAEDKVAGLAHLLDPVKAKPAEKAQPPSANKAQPVAPNKAAK